METRATRRRLTAPTPEAAATATDTREADAKTRVAGIVTSADAVRGPLPFTALPSMAGGYGSVQERVFTLPDPDGEYAELESRLMLGSREFDSVSSALDQAEDNARRAHKLYVNARLAFEQFTIDADLVDSAMWGQAQGELQKEKDAGTRSKAITEADVKHKCLVLFPDEYRDLQMRRVSGRKMLEHLERFADLWKTRCFSLAKQLEARR